MRVYLILCAVLLLCVSAHGQKKKNETPKPVQFEVGVLTFFDFGPPNEYYSLYVVRPTEGGSKVERIILTPQADRCFAPAKFERVVATLNESVDELLGAKNPCAIPEKDLRKELKRCKHCLAYSGANVTMRVSCGEETRVIRSDILDHDMFNPAVKTPENTSWTMQLLGRLEKASGPGVMDKPMFPALQERMAEPWRDVDDSIVKGIAGSGFDGPFASGSLKFSDLYRQSRDAQMAHPTVSIKEIKPILPEKQVTPAYPRITYLTHSEGTVTARFTVLDDGTPNILTLLLIGNQLFKGVVQDALTGWKFPKETGGKEAEVTFEFALNCPK